MYESSEDPLVGMLLQGSLLVQLCMLYMIKTTLQFPLFYCLVLFGRSCHQNLVIELNSKEIELKGPFT